MFHISAKPFARAKLRGEDAVPSLWGEVSFYPHQWGTLVVAEVGGLPVRSGFLGFHIHRGSSCKGKGFSETQGHYDSGTNPHPRHAGDLPPLLSAAGYAFSAFVTDRFTPEEILGKTIVIHAMADDLHTQPAGDSGDKIACGVICRCR